MSVLKRKFYNRDPRKVARDLLGKYLVRKLQEGAVLSGMIVEIEAYLGDTDPASHSYKGKTKRNSSLYKRGGHAYVHTQRHHTLLDVVTGSIETPYSLLIRSVEPREGIGHMQKNREKETLMHLTDGPGKLCQALEITKAMDGVDLTSPKSGLWIEERGMKISSKQILKTPRIGIGKGKELLLRFVLIL